MGDHLRSLRRLCNPRRALLLLRIFAFAALVPLLARLKPRTLDDLLGSGAAHDELDPDSALRIVTYVEFVLAHGRPVVRPSCITRGLTLYYFLRRGGADVALCFGVGNLAGNVAGHCWLIRNGEAYLEPEDPGDRFTEMYRLPLGPRTGVTAGGPAPEGPVR